MRPYLAIVKDSFREAMASRILPFLLVLLTLTLLMLAPLGLEEEMAWELRQSDVHDRLLLAQQIDEDRQDEGPTPGKRIWDLISDEFKTDLAKWDEAVRELQEELRKPPAERRQAQQRRRLPSINLVGELNRVLQQRAFYDKAAWEGVRLNDEAEAYLERGVDDLSRTEVARLNRLLLDAAYPNAIQPVSESQVEFTWAWTKPFESFLEPRSKTEATEWIKSALSAIATYLVGKFGVFVAILVSAGIIPRMFEAGSIDLLLSKPINRSLLFLTKFFSGCAFIFINAGYFMLGLFLIAGLRFGIWEPDLLLSVPVFMFVFAIVYSISALAGVLWKNPIISAIVAMIVWLMCMGLGFIKNSVDAVRDSLAATTIVSAGDDLLVSTNTSFTYLWDPTQEQWVPTEFRNQTTPAFLGPQSYMVGPVYDAQNKRLVAIEGRTMFGQPSGMGQLLIAEKANLWAPEPGAHTPTDASYLFIDPEGRIVVAGRSGVYRIVGDPTIPADPLAELFGGSQFSEPDPPELDGPADGGPAEGGQPEENAGEEELEPGRFVQVGPRSEAGLGRPFAAAMNPADGSLAVYTGSTLKTLGLSADGQYVVDRSKNLKTDQSALVAYAGDTIVVAFADGSIEVYDARSLKRKEQFEAFDDHEPKSVVAAPGGRWFAVLFHQNSLWLYDEKAGEAIDPDEIDGQGDITAVSFPSGGRMVVADSFNSVSSYVLDPLKQVESFEPEGGTAEITYRVISIFYLILPKPGDLDEVIDYLFTDEKTKALTRDETDLQAERHVYDLWTPIWSNLLFLTVVLGYTCWRISRWDF